jgi:hypothetical protein
MTTKTPSFTKAGTNPKRRGEKKGDDMGRLWAGGEGRLGKSV